MPRLKCAALLAAIAALTGMAHGDGAAPIGEPLPEAEAGACFARVRVPAVYREVPVELTTREAYDAVEVRQASFAPDKTEVKVRDEAVRYRVTEPRYETVTEKVLVRPAHQRLEVEPATFRTVSETVQVSEPRLVWKPGKNLSPIRRRDPDTGELYCLVETPGETRTVQRREVVTSEQVRMVDVPAQYRTVTKQVLVEPARVEKIDMPAEFETVATQRLSRPAEHGVRPVAAETETLSRKVVAQPERFEWVGVLCETNADASVIRTLQNALASRGYYDGPPDGVYGPQTERAVAAFQADEGLPHGGILSVDTLVRLGLRAPRPSPPHTSARPGAGREDRDVSPRRHARPPASPAPRMRDTARPATSRRLSWRGKSPG